MIFQKYVFIQLPGEENPVPSGLFHLDTNLGVGRFEYGYRYMDRPNAIAIDPINLPLTKKTFTTKINNGFFGVIADVLPDSWGKFILAKKNHVPFGSLANHQLLELTDSNAVGALSFEDSPDKQTSKKIKPADFSEIQEIASIYDKVLADKELPPEVLFLLEQGTSLGGAQPKCAVVKNNIEYIAKFESSKTLVKYPRIEFVTMKLAQKAGINIPELLIEEINGRAVYLIQRFDRKENNKRLPFLSAMALSNLDIYELENGSYLSMANDMRKFVKDVKSDLEQLFRRIVFNILVRNEDDHLRNHGFIYDGYWALSPAYDIVPMVARSKGPFHLCLSFGDFGTIASLPNIYSCCNFFGVPQSKAIEIVEQTKTVISNWEKEMLHTGVPQNDIELIRDSFSYNV